MVKPAITFVSVLDCFHTIELNPAPEEEDKVYCSRCGDYRSVALVSAEWRIRCATCRHGRKYGSDEMTARRAAGKHAVEHGHDVKVMLGGSQVDLISPPGAPLPGILGWVKAHPEHQGMLRRDRPTVDLA